MAWDIEMELYQKMYLIRRAEEMIIEHYDENEMKTPCHMSMGAEAIAVGVCSALKTTDQVLTSYRSHAVFLAKTMDTDRFFAELYGKVTGTAEGRAGSMHLAAPDKGHMISSAVVGSYLPMALGLAFANKQQRNGRAVAVFFGDGALDEGVFFETLNVACLMKLPVMFILEDNGYSVQTPTSARQGYRSITDIVRNFNCICLDLARESNESFAVYQVRRKLAAIRPSITDWSTPAFIRLEYYRYLEHVGVHEDFDAGYRERPKEWPDPIRMQRELLETRGTPPYELYYLEQAVNEKLARSLKLAREAPLPAPDSLYKGVFFEPAHVLPGP